MTTVRQLLEYKGHEVIGLSPNDSVYRAIELMADRGIGALMILEDKALVGIISERDYARKVILQGKSSKATLIGDIMTTHLICVAPDTEVDDCMSLMTGKRMRHLPVIEDEKIIGVISIGDIVRQVLEEKEFTIQQLERYICSG